MLTLKFCEKQDVDEIAKFCNLTDFKLGQKIGEIGPLLKSGVKPFKILFYSTNGSR